MRGLNLHKPYFVVVIGIPGSGKTEFATRFADMFQSVFIDIKELVDYGMTAVNATKFALKLFNSVSRTGQTVIFEGVTGNLKERQKLAKLAKSKGYQPVFVWLQLKPELARDRITRKTKANPNPISHAHFEKLVTQFMEPGDRENAIVISGTHTYASQARTVLRHLSVERPTMERPEPVNPKRPSNIQIKPPARR